MENKILIGPNWQDRIRDKMGVDDTYLPNSVIEQPDIIKVAETNIISLFPDYSNLDGDSKTYLESAIVLECCVLLSPSMAARLPKKQSGPHAGHELYVNWDNKKAEFQEERDFYVGKIFDLEFPELLSSPLPYFRVTYPKRPWQGK